MLKLAYNTNGFLCHTLEDAIEILAEIGYRGISVTLDTHHLDPQRSGPREISRIAGLLDRCDLAVAIETGGRYVLDPKKKHYPTLVSKSGAEKRISFLEKAIDISHDLGSSVVSFWSGKKEEGTPTEDAYTQLARGLERLITHSEKRGVSLAFEPEPGMLVEGQEDLARLDSLLGTAVLPLTLDVGHLFLTEKSPPEVYLERERKRLVNVHIEDMMPGVHEHLPFGEGEIEVRPILQTLVRIEYGGLVSVELSRTSHRAPETATEAFSFLSQLLGDNV